MKFKELVDRHAWNDVQSILLLLYPDEEKSIEGYRQVYETLRSLQPAETKLRICIKTVTDDFDGATYEHVSGKDGTTNRETAPEADWDDERGNQEASFGIEFTDWAEWLGMEIDSETAARYSEPEIIGHCLWEMTFFGFSEDKIRKFMDDVEESVRSGEWHTLEDVEKLFDNLDEIDEDPAPQKAGDVP